MLKSAKGVGSRMLSLALTLVLVVTAVPLFGLTAAAEDESGIVYGEISVMHIDTSSVPEKTTIDTMYGVISYTGDERTVIIPSANEGRAVEYIKDYAFAGTGVTSVKLPDTLRGIGKGAFMDCQYLNTVVIGTNASISDFGEFADYTAVVAENSSIIGDSVFANCVSLRHFAVYTDADPATLSITNLATAKTFAGCAPLMFYGWGMNNVVKAYSDSSAGTYVDLSVVAQNVKGISIAPKSTFMALKETEQLTVSILPSLPVGIAQTIYSYLTSDPNIISVDDYGFMTAIGYGTATVTVVSINGFSDSCTVTVAERVEGDYIYRFLNDGRNVEIVKFDSGVAGDISVPATIAGKPVTAIGDYAFKGCTGIKSLTLPDTVNTIGIGAFYDCTGLAVFTAPASLVSVAGSAFYGCTSLSFIDFGNCANLISIGDAAFRNCSSLAAVFVPKSLATIGGDAFIGDTVLKIFAITDSGSKLVIDPTWFDASAPSIIYNPEKDIIDDVTAFEWVSLEPTMIIGQSAVLAVNATIGGVVIDNYAQAAFATDNKNVLNVSGEKITAVGAGIASLYAIAPNGFISSVKITVTKGASGDYEYCLIENMTKAEIVGYTNDTATSTVVPATVSFKGSDIPVTSIGFAAFADATALKTITIGAGITSVNGSSFDCAYALEEILVAAGNASYTAVDGVLFNAAKTALIKYPASKAGEVYQIPAGIVNLGNYAFKDNKYLTYIKFPAKLTTIGSHCFESMESLMSAVLPSNVTEIGEFAFAYTPIDYVLIPQKTAVIGASAFLGTPVIIYGYKGYYAEIYAAENGETFKAASLLVEVGEIRLSANVVALDIGDTYTLTASIYPASASFPKYTFESADPAIATIDADGEIKAMAVGTTQIIAKSSCGVKTFCTVVVTDDTSATPVDISSIDIRVTPDKTVYENGEPLDLAGIRVYAIYNDGSESLIVDSGNLEPGVRIRGYSAFAAGSQSIEVIYGDRIGVFSVTVLEKKLVSIAVSNPPDKTTYVIGTPLVTEGIVVTATYNNGTTADVTSLCTFSVIPAKLGNASIKVMYDTCKTSFTVNVVEKSVVGIAINAPTKTVYYQGDTLDTTGFSAVATYNNGTTATFYAEDFEFTGYNMNTPGKQDVSAVFTDIDGTKITGSFPITVTALVVTGIRIPVSPDKLIYENGEALDLTGAEIYATYNNGTEVKIFGTGVAPGTYLYKTRNFNSMKVGAQAVEIVFGEKIGIINVTVLEKKLVSIAVTTPPEKTTYVIGTPLVTEGIVVTATYNNGTTEDVTSLCTFSAIPAKLGNASITVKYDTCKTSFAVSVIEKSVINISIKAPTKTEYYQGDAFDTSGFSAEITYDNGTTGTLYATDFEFNGYDMDAPGKQQVFAVYTTADGKKFTSSFSIAITAVRVTGIRVSVNPDKMTYENGDAFDLTGAEIFATYNNGAEVKIYGTGVAPDSYTIKIRNYDPLKAGAQTIELVYDSFVTTLTVTVLERKLIGIEITSLPLNATCVEGGTVDTLGLVVTAIYNNGQREAVTDYTTSPAPTAIGASTITVFYKGFADEFTVTIIKKSLVSIEITQPLKSAYIEGDTLDTTGFAATGTYNNGTTAELPAEDFVFTGYKSGKVGNQTVTATYTDENGKTFSKKFIVTVTARTLQGIEIMEQPDKQVYIEGEKLDLTGMVVRAYYNNNTYEVLSPKYLFEFDKTLALGETYFTLEYEGFKDTFKVLAVLGNYQDQFSYRFVNNATGIEVVKAFSSLEGDYTLPSKIGKFPLVSLAVNSFLNNDFLTRVVIPDSVTTLGINVFSGCDWLNTVIIGNGVIAIPDKAFFGCDALNMVVLPDSIRQIGEFAFSQCASLLCVVIPEKTIVIAKNAFEYGNKKLTIVGADESYAQTYAAANKIKFTIKETLTKNDIDGNGKFDIVDARKAVRLAAGLDTVNGTQFLLADVDSSGVISLSDARQLLRESAGLK